MSILAGAGVNEVKIGDERYLIVLGGERDHLARAVPAGSGVGAYRFGDDRSFTFPRGYSRRLLTKPDWSPKTLCGREWWIMARGDGPPRERQFEDDEPVFAPTCRACLRSVGRRLADTAEDPRIALLAQLASREVLAECSTSVFGVPGDQTRRLADAIRREVKAAGYQCRTYITEPSENTLPTVFVWSEQVYDEKPQEWHDAAAARARAGLERVLRGIRPVRSERGFRWTAWDLS